MKKTIIVLLILLFAIQFIRPEKNTTGINDNHISNAFVVPDEVKLILKNSCNDCHSNATIYPWYSEIAPASWYLAQHVNDGKKHLNFSEWMNYNANQKKHIINDLEEVLEEQEMPLKSYTLVHETAKLTPFQYQILKDWVATIKVD
ncbi:heme-binding domain-containing protein [Lutibacter sp.]|uniref:heme-binding domain-containing protein n=1 Tax=Lutibacter sp. TaxID=1925666 RepID=UPI0027352FEA|nr:heme-binding domain-containing protein [Lutibacter sp.]MDP3312794.1 heme-binding domain-containing protein [Lutibacter sp.]